jgi:hypothetical protein
MTLAPDKIELAQQIADALEEGINAGPVPTKKHIRIYKRKKLHCFPAIS